MKTPLQITFRDIPHSDALEIGDEVRFTEEAGDEGPQASTVHLIGKHHIVE